MQAPDLSLVDPDGSDLLSPGPEMIRLLIAYGDHLSRAGVEALLDDEPDIMVAGSAGDGEIKDRFVRRPELPVERNTVENARLPSIRRLGKWVAGVGLLVATSLFVVDCGDGGSGNTSGVLLAWGLLRGLLAVRQLPVGPHEVARVAVRDPL